MESKHGDVLVVEDDAALNRLICMYVKLSGMPYRSALDGATALREANAELPVLILLDLMLPDTTGFEVCESLKGDERTCNVPVVMVTAMADDESRRRGLECGAAEYLVKPVLPDRLIETIKKYAA